MIFNLYEIHTCKCISLVQYVVELLFLIQNETPPEQAPEPGNFQPHLVVFTHDEYDQYFVAVEWKLCMECIDLATALFHLLGCHYILNLRYHQKLSNMMRFIQEKVAGIPSPSSVRSKSPVSTFHIVGISSEYAVMKESDSKVMNSVSDEWLTIVYCILVNEHCWICSYLTLIWARFNFKIIMNYLLKQ